MATNLTQTLFWPHAATIVHAVMQSPAPTLWAKPFHNEQDIKHFIRWAGQQRTLCHLLFNLDTEKRRTLMRLVLRQARLALAQGPMPLSALVTTMLAVRLQQVNYNTTAQDGVWVDTISDLLRHYR